MAYVQRPRGIRGDKFNDDVLRLRRVRMPVGIALAQDTRNDPPARGRGQEDVDEARARDFCALDPRRRLERADKRGGELARVALERLGKLQRDVARVVAMQRLLGAFERERLRTITRSDLRKPS